MNIQSTEVVGVFPIAGDKGYNIKLNNGNKYTLWGDGAPRPCNNGDLVSFDYTQQQNGSYTNRTIAKSGVTVETPDGIAPPVTRAPAQAQTASRPASDDAKQNMIVGQNCLGHATKLVIAFPEHFNIAKGNITTTVTQVASVLAKAVVSGDLYKEPAFDDDISVLTGDK